MENERLSSVLRKKGRIFLYYLTHRDNVASILCKGILSKNRIEIAGLEYTSIAKDSVQRRRNRIEAFGRPIHDYVPLYLV
jgi:hypothetical protein